MSLVIAEDVLFQLVARAANGDETAFARIVAANHDDMARVAYVVTGDLDAAQEAAHAAWPIVWRKLRTLRDPARLRPWLLSVAANEARQLVRSRTRRSVREIVVGPELELSDDRRGDPSGRASEVDLRNALLRLSVDDRSIVAMRYAAGLSSAEIGQVVGMTGGGVRARLARLLDRLREDLGDD